MLHAAICDDEIIAKEVSYKLMKLCPDYAADVFTNGNDLIHWTFEQAVSYYKLALINYIGFNDKGMLLARGCGDTNGQPQITKTQHLEKAYTSVEDTDLLQKFHYQACC